MFKITRSIILLFAVIFIVSACNLPTNVDTSPADPNAVFTAAAQTASVQLTQAAENRQPTQSPPTSPPLQPPTLAPSATPSLPIMTPTQECDKADFIKDVTIPDGAVFAPGETFTKTWRIKNIGTCTWTTGYALIFDGGSAMGGFSPQPLTGSVSPGQTVDISVNMTAPNNGGDYVGNWQIRNASNVLFAKIYVMIKVQSGPFAVTSVNMSVSGSCGGFTITANITSNGAGAVTYKWKRSDGAIDNANHPDVVFASAGTKSVNTTWSVSATGSHWMDIYIDEPNHQQFGRANFSCP